MTLKPRLSSIVSGIQWLEKLLNGVPLSPAQETHSNQLLSNTGSSQQSFLCLVLHAKVLYQFTLYICTHFSTFFFYFVTHMTPLSIPAFYDTLCAGSIPLYDSLLLHFILFYYKSHNSTHCHDNFYSAIDHRSIVFRFIWRHLMSLSKSFSIPLCTPFSIPLYRQHSMKKLYSTICDGILFRSIRQPFLPLYQLWRHPMQLHRIENVGLIEVYSTLSSILFPSICRH